MNLDLTSKVVLITGASRGIGAEAARRMGEAGAQVAVNYSRSEEEAREVVARIGTDRAFAVQADVSDPAQVESMIDAVLARFGRIDVLVNNAGWHDYNRYAKDNIIASCVTPGFVDTEIARAELERHYDEIIDIPHPAARLSVVSCRLSVTFALRPRQLTTDN